MRKFIGLAMVVAFMGVAAGPALALHALPADDLEIDFNDWSSFFHNGVAIGGNVPGAAVPEEGDELRALYRAGQIHGLETGEVISAADEGEELTGLLYDLVVGVTPVDIPVLGLDAGDPMISVAAGVARIGLVPGPRYSDSTIPGSGGRIDVWLDTTLTGSQPLGTNSPGGGSVYQDPDGGNDGPSEWVAAGGVGNTFPTHDDFPGASDLDTDGVSPDPGASMWLSAVLVPMPVGIPLSAGFTNVFPGAVYVITVDLINNVGSAFGFADVIYNNTGAQILDDAFSSGIPGFAGGDISIQSILSFSNAQTRSLNGWDALSDDPILMSTFVPEPASMSLLLVGLVGSAGAWYRRRRAA
jgi:hypothetical protein